MLRSPNFFCRRSNFLFIRPTRLTKGESDTHVPAGLVLKFEYQYKVSIHLDIKRKPRSVRIRAYELLNAHHSDEYIESYLVVWLNFNAIAGCAEFVAFTVFGVNLS
jgi:hypothetical protein